MTEDEARYAWLRENVRTVLAELACVRNGDQLDQLIDEEIQKTAPQEPGKHLGELTTRDGAVWCWVNDKRWMRVL